ncbi:hypothetical protein [Amnibacterium endophyticum]|uniref:Uncharacterized protein n=1 Tax=Amnibacterium endophyticum TaxID=2109337 RepID=A0ABW4LFC4_9MICO
MQTPIEDTLPDVPDDADTVALAEVVDELAQMNSDDWSTFVDSSTTGEARVEFAFSAPNEDVATTLSESLMDDAAYEAGTKAPEDELAEWTVEGRTPGVSVTEAGLRVWVERLAAYGIDHDGCVLDGWAVVLP